MKKAIKKAIATTALIAKLATPLSAESGDNDFGRDSDFQHPAVEMNWADFQKITEFEYTSQRPDSENGEELGGVVHTYEVLRRGDELAIREAGRNVLVGMMPYWDINQDGERGAMEQEARDEGYLTDFSSEFTDAFYSALTKALDSRTYQDGDLEKTVSHRIAGILGGFGGHDSKRGDFKGIEAGIALDKFYEKFNMGLDLTGRMAFGENGKLLEEITTEPSATGIYGHGTITQEDMKIYGLALDFKAGANGFYSSVGTGLAWMNSTDKTVEELKRGEDVLVSNDSYASESVFSPEFRVGLGYTCNKSGLGFGLTGAVNTQGRVSIGGRISYGAIRKTQHRGSKK